MDAFGLLEKHIQHGQLTLRLPDGQVRRFGGGTPHTEWIIHKPGTLGRIALYPEMMLGETYMNGAWDAAQHDLRALLAVLMMNFPERHLGQRGGALGLLTKFLRRSNGILRSRRNVAHHYDLDEWLFRHFLDHDMQYSCAYYYQSKLDINEAQRAKRAYISRKLLVEPGQRVLDIGCGWGGLALDLAEHAGVHVTGLTLSHEQLRVAESRAKQRGLQDRVEFRLEDYRRHCGHYDRIVSVGMFEHVGLSHYPHYFDQVRRLLHPDGVALLHTIGRLGPPGVTNPWIAKHIFPGGYNPALSEMSGVIERSGLFICDVEVLRLHYAHTLAAWYQRFQTQRAQVCERMGERFCRMWEFYLAACEGAFRWRDLAVFQVQLARRLDAVPITRDYLYQDHDVDAAAPIQRNVSGAH